MRVRAGEKLTERQALEAMLIPSGNNIAWMLARWDAGSDGAFVATMNARARSLGLRQTRYADASGADPATVSTAADQFRLTLRALQPGTPTSPWTPARPRPHRRYAGGSPGSDRAWCPGMSPGATRRRPESWPA